MFDGTLELLWGGLIGSSIPIATPTKQLFVLGLGRSCPQIDALVAVSSKKSCLHKQHYSFSCRSTLKNTIPRTIFCINELTCHQQEPSKMITIPTKTIMTTKNNYHDHDNDNQLCHRIALFIWNTIFQHKNLSPTSTSLNINNCRD